VSLKAQLVQQGFEKGALKSLSMQRPTGKHENDTLRYRRPQEGAKWQGLAGLVASGATHGEPRGPSVFRRPWAKDTRRARKLGKARSIIF
jgi:hypothetical protein